MASIGKAELVGIIAEKLSKNKTDIEAFLNTAIDAIAEEVVKGNKIQLMGFGSFEKRDRAARTGRNPQTGANIVIPASKTPAFKPGKTFKEMCNIPC